MKLTWTNLTLLFKKGMTVKNLKMSYLSKFLSINVIFDHEFHMKYSSNPTNYNTSVDSKSLQLLSCCNLKNIEN